VNRRKYGGLSCAQVGALLGVDEHRANQASDHALDVAAVLASKNLPALLRAIAHRMEHPTVGMREMGLRRERLLKRLRPGGGEPETSEDWEIQYEQRTGRRDSPRMTALVTH